ncbi:MFS transporter [Aeromicrobium duanguangcaii]|uniref:MFS transporter n=1 Tax=Aeromicrobium duanguangcaii TaxID=2968086 RepID=A0ABY5KDV4_9ACTN|nr:MFS transporter [Aeromicrobium duanguangcaii]MCD9155296.1 MFS transporter [Aeromicrobium duanguangcaii]MCL3838647.1 MFS transporter [Aeromicrobium duanguangcaii]UUI68055.1 MFS transporter [Aeromicrobium duanguangcaii]
MSSTFRSLSIRNYRVYAMGALVSNVGTWMQRVAQDWLILTLTGSGTALGITTGLQLLPALLFSPVAGVVADRFPKQQILKVTQLAMALPAVVLGVLAVTGAVEAWHVYVIAFVFGVGTAFDAPARQSFVAEMVGSEDLSNAVGLNSASFNTARMIGPALAGLLIAALGSGVKATGWVILANAVSYVAVIASLTALDARRLHPSPVSGSRKGAVREGVRYVRSRPDLVLLLICVFFVGTFGMNFQMTSALMATEVYGKGASEYGILGSILAIGSLVGALLAARRTRPRLIFVVVAGLAFGIAEIVAGMMPTYTTFALILPLLGLSSLTMVTSANGLIQLTAAPQMRGRVAALYLMVFMGGTPVGAPLIGWVGEEFGARWTLILGGGASVAGILVATLLYARTHHLWARRRVSPAARRMLHREGLDEEALVSAE